MGIGKAAGAWGLDVNANESKRGFLLNHVISEELPEHKAGKHLSNSDPITGQAAWYDVRVRVYKADDQENQITQPQFKPMKPLPGMAGTLPKLINYIAGKYRGNK